MIRSIDRRLNYENRPLIELIEKLGGFPIWDEINSNLPNATTGTDFVETLVKFSTQGVDFDALFSLGLRRHPTSHRIGFALSQPVIKCE